MRCVFVFSALFLSAPAFAQAGPVGGIGRYVIVHSPHVQRDTILLDTVTGKTWQQRTINSRPGETSRPGDIDVWFPMARTDNPEENTQLNNQLKIDSPTTQPPKSNQISN
jgi:hypothetical protein